MLREIADRRKDLFFDVFYTGADLPESSDNFISHGYVPNLYEHLAEGKNCNCAWRTHHPARGHAL